MQRAGVVLMSGILLICIANALLYTKWIANPVIGRDAWYFLDVFISKHLDGSLQWTDYFVKRGASDHSQPLQKLLLALNTDWFALDFLYEALIGFIGMVICCFYLIAIALGTVRRRLQPGDVCLVSLIPLLLFSLNSVEIYAWSLVILFYVVLPFALLLFSSSYRPGGAWRMAAVFLAAVICLVLMDNSGLLVCLVAIAALMSEPLRGSGWRSAVMRMLPIAAAIVLYRWAYTLVIPPFPPEAPRRPVETLNALIAHGDQAWKWAILPAAASVVHPDSFAAVISHPSYLLTVAAGLIVVALHAAFWVSVFRTPAVRHGTFMAVCLMLFVYSATAGVVAGRVPEYGWNYLLQYRYVAFYQLANIALVLQWLSARNSVVAAAPSRMPGRGRSEHWLRRLLPVAALIAVALLQLGLSLRAWHQGRYIRAYSRGMAQTIFCLASHPDIEVPVCEPLHPVCDWRPEVRNRLVGLLRDHQLSVFSRGFQLRHGMQPDLPADDRCLPPAKAATGGARPMVVNEVVDVRASSDPESGDKVIIGSILGSGFRQGDMVVINNGPAFGTVFGSKFWITFSIPPSAVGYRNSFTIHVIRPSSDERSRAFSVSVKRELKNGDLQLPRERVKRSREWEGGLEVFWLAPVRVGEVRSCAFLIPSPAPAELSAPGCALPTSS
jgi:hypothetical protein